MSIFSSDVSKTVNKNRSKGLFIRSFFGISKNTKRSGWEQLLRIALYVCLAGIIFWGIVLLVFSYQVHGLQLDIQKHNQQNSELNTMLSSYKSDVFAIQKSFIDETQSQNISQFVARLFEIPEKQWANTALLELHLDPKNIDLAYAYSGSTSEVSKAVSQTQNRYIHELIKTPTFETISYKKDPEVRFRGAPIWKYAHSGMQANEPFNGYKLDTYFGQKTLLPPIEGLTTKVIRYSKDKGSVYLEWTPANTDMIDFKTYYVLRGKSSDKLTPVAKTTNPNFGAMLNLTDSETYFFAAVVEDRDGNVSTVSNIVEANFANNKKLPAVSNLQVQRNHNILTFTWDPIENRQVQGYRVYRKLGDRLEFVDQVKDPRASVYTPSAMLQEFAIYPVNVSGQIGLGAFISVL